jgi:hypothetical protein
MNVSVGEDTTIGLVKILGVEVDEVCVGTWVD